MRTVQKKHSVENGGDGLPPTITSLTPTTASRSFLARKHQRGSRLLHLTNPRHTTDTNPTPKWVKTNADLITKPHITTHLTRIVRSRSFALVHELPPLKISVSERKRAFRGFRALRDPRSDLYPLNSLNRRRPLIQFQRSPSPLTSRGPIPGNPVFYQE
jgi:hypothetical protein